MKPFVFVFTKGAPNPTYVNLVFTELEYGVPHESISLPFYALADSFGCKWNVTEECNIDGYYTGRYIYSFENEESAIMFKMSV